MAENSEKLKAIMKTKHLTKTTAVSGVALACAVVGWLFCAAPTLCEAQVVVVKPAVVIQPPVVVVPPPVVVQPAVIVAPAPVVVAPPPPPPPPPAPEPEVNFQYFHDQLAPFGTWVEVAGIGMVWQPNQAIIGLSPGWRPYYDNGQWVQTENGLFWKSDYTWGDIPFHYGRWTLTPNLGWVWVPDYTWGPSWVFWRHAEGDGAVGWAALPPGALFVNGVFMFNGVAVAADYDFGLHEDCFVFVEGGHFHERFFRMRGREWRYHVERERLHGFYGHSVVRNEFRRDEHGRFVNNGIGRERLEHMNSHIEQRNFEERHPVGDREKEIAKNEHREPGHDEHGKTGPGGSAGQHDEHAKAAPGGTAAQHDEHNTGKTPTQTMADNNHKGLTGNGGSTSGMSKVFRPPTPTTSLAKSNPGTTGAHAAPPNNSGGSKKK